VRGEGGSKGERKSEGVKGVGSEGWREVGSWGEGGGEDGGSAQKLSLDVGYPVQAE